MEKTTGMMQQLKPNWEFVSDTVMGGVSSGSVTEEIVGGCDATVLRGTVSLKNNGGFIQMAFDLHEGGTAQLSRPWQSFRADFVGEPHWQKVRIPFSSLVPHRVDAAFDPNCLRRIGILAIGCERDAYVAVSNIGLYSAN